MKVLLVHNFYRQRLVGGEDVVFRRERDSLKKLLGEENVLVHTVSSDDLNAFTLLVNVFFSIPNFIKVYRLVKRSGVDVVHCHNYFPMLSFSPFWAAKLAGAKTVLSLHNYRLWCISANLFREGRICHDCIGKRFSYPGIAHKCYYNSYVLSALIAVSVFIYRLHLRSVDRLFALTQFQATFLKEEIGISPQKVLVKGNFMPKDFKPEAGTSIKKYDLIFIGKLEEEKGVLEIVEAFQSTLEDHTLCIVGDGPLREKLEQSITNNITLTGRLDNDEVKGLIVQSRFLVHLSVVYETFGLTILEAMSMGVPVLAYPIGTRLEFIVNGENGYFMDRDNLGNSILQAMNTPADQYELLSTRAKNTASQYSEEEIMAHQLTLYQKIIDED